MKAIFTILLILILIQPQVLSYNSSAISSNVCDLISSNSTETVNIYMNQPPITFVSIDSCVQYFVNKIDDYNLLGKYLIFEVKYQNNVPKNDDYPVLIYKRRLKPTIIINEYKEFTTNFLSYDQNGVENKKEYANIVVDIGTFEFSEYLYFGIYHNFTNASSYNNITLEYQVSIRSSDAFPCPNDCSSKGVCNLNTSKKYFCLIQEKCDCNLGWLDLDCSIGARALLESLPLSISLPAKSWTYIYFPTGDSMNYHFSSVPDSNDLTAAFLVGSSVDSKLPNFYIYEILKKITTTDNSISFSTGGSGLAKIGIYNPQNQPISQTFSLSSEKITNHTLAIVLGIIGGILLLVVLFFAIRAIQRRLKAKKYSLSSKEKKEEAKKKMPENGSPQNNSSTPFNICGLCSNSIDQMMEFQLSPPCPHFFHEDCHLLLKKQNKKCPNCQTVEQKTFGNDDEEKIEDLFPKLTSGHRQSDELITNRIDIQQKNANDAQWATDRPVLLDSLKSDDINLHTEKTSKDESEN